MNNIEFLPPPLKDLGFATWYSFCINKQDIDEPSGFKIRGDSIDKKIDIQQILIMCTLALNCETQICAKLDKNCAQRKWFANIG